MISRAAGTAQLENALCQSVLTAGRKARHTRRLRMEHGGAETYQSGR